MNKKKSRNKQLQPDYLILNAGWGIEKDNSTNAMAAAEVLLEDKTENVFHVSLVVPSGMPIFFRTRESVLDKLLHEYPREWTEDDIHRFYDELHQNHMLLAEDDYACVLLDHTENAMFPVFRYLIWLILCDPGEKEVFIETSKNRWLSQIVVPRTEIEKTIEEQVAREASAAP